MPLTPSKCLSKWIKLDKWDYFQNDFQDVFFFFILNLIYFYETIVRGSSLSFGHSDPDPRSLENKKLHSLLCFTVLHNCVHAIIWPEKFLRSTVHSIFIGQKALKAGLSEEIVIVIVLVLVLNFKSFFCDLLASVNLAKKVGCKGQH